MRIENDLKLDLKDVLIRPKRSTLGSRSNVDVTRTFRFLYTGAEWGGCVYRELYRQALVTEAAEERHSRNPAH